MKKCSTCKETKPISDFHRNRATKDGFAYVCKKCAYISTKSWRENNIERYRELDKANKANQRKRDGPELTKEKWNNWYQNNKEHRRAYQQEHRDENKARVHNAVQYALNHGKLKRPEHCSNCDKKCKPDAHHEDYEKPLEVIWLCRSCHRNYHLANV